MAISVLRVRVISGIAPKSCRSSQQSIGPSSTPKDRNTVGGSPALKKKSECHPLDSHNKVLARLGGLLSGPLISCSHVLVLLGIVEDCVGAKRGAIVATSRSLPFINRNPRFPSDQRLQKRHKWGGPKQGRGGLEWRVMVNKAD